MHRKNSDNEYKRRTINTTSKKFLIGKIFIVLVSYAQVKAM